MKRSIKLTNHEIYTECTKCGFIYDAHLSGKDCPRCGFTMYRVISKLIYPLAILLMFCLIGSSCGITKQYGYRNHRNTVAQKVIQYEASKPYKWGDWKACQHFSERPKSHWPLRD